MAQVKLKIEVNPNAETEKIGDITNKVNDVGSTSNLSNVSIKAKDNGMFIVKEMNNNGRELLSFGESGSLKFTQDGYLTSNGITKGELASEQNPDMFVWGVVPSNKQYSVKLTFTNAQNLKDIVVYGDKVSNQFPIEAIIDNKKVIYSNDYRWAINLGVESDTHTIEFTKWNRGDYNACLTLIRVMLRYFEISNSSGLIELESLSQSNSQPKEIYYGLIPNTGSASVNDNYGEINDLINEEIITNSMNNIEIYIDDKKIQHHITTDSDYEDGKVFTMELENSLSFLETKYAGRNLTDSMSAYSLLREVLETLNYTQDRIDSMLDREIVYGNNEIGSVKSYLEKITIEYPYLESSTYRETLNKFCTLAQLNLMEDDYGNLKFVSARPVETKNTDVIVIPINRQFSRLVKDEFLKNKYNKPFVQYCEFKGEESLFGETKNASYREDNGQIYLDEDYDFYYYLKKPLTKSLYDEIYNISDKNAMFDSTEKILFKNSYYYRTRVILPISNENIIKDLDNLYLSVNGIRAGTNSIQYTAYGFGPVGEDTSYITTYKYVPYKTNTYSFKTKFKEGQLSYEGLANVYIQNLNIQKNYVEFDILFGSDIIDSAKSDYMLFVLSANFQLYGDVYKYNFIENKEYSDIEISGNELIQEGTLYNGQRISELNQTNIVVDYTKGIRTASISIACLDYYDTKGNKAIDWSKQEILQVGQIVRIDKDNLGNSKVNYINGEPYLWKITGRRFRYNGVPMLDLQLQEVKLNTYFMINENLPEYVVASYTRVSSEYGGSIGEISKKDILYPNDVIKVDYTIIDNPIYSLGNGYVNGNQFSSGNTITIEDNLNLVVETYLNTFNISANVEEGATLIIERLESPNGKADLGIVDVNTTFYYGDVINIDWNLESGYEVRGATFNGNPLYGTGFNEQTIVKNSTIIIPTIKLGWTTKWSGNFYYNILGNDGTTSEIMIDLDQYGDRGIQLNPNAITRFTFEQMVCSYGDLATSNINSFEGFDIIYKLGEIIYGGDLSGAGSDFSNEPTIRFELYDNGDDTTKLIKVFRSLGIYNSQNCMFSEFTLVKIEQYISN